MIAYGKSACHQYTGLFNPLFLNVYLDLRTGNISSWNPEHMWQHDSDAIMRAMSSRLTDVSVVCSNVCSSADQRKHQSSASQAFVIGNHRWPVGSPHRGPVTRKYFHLLASHNGEAFRVSILPANRHKSTLLESWYRTIFICSWINTHIRSSVVTTLQVYEINSISQVSDLSEINYLAHFGLDPSEK